MTNKRNPVAGLRELTREQLRVGDEVVIYDEIEKTYVQVTIGSPDNWRFVENAKFYLVDRSYPEEPEGAGTVVRIVRTNSFEYYVRIVSGDPISEVNKFRPWVELVHGFDIEGTLYANACSWANIVDMAVNGDVELIREGVEIEWR